MKRALTIYALLIGVLLVLTIVNLTSGSVQLSPSETLRILLSHDASSVEGAIIWRIRAPRLVAAATLGGGVALSGYLLQAFFANPIAGPYILGISSGSKLVVATLLVAACRFSISVHSFMLVVAAFIGAGVATLFVLLAARKARNMATLIVCGVMIGYICSAATELVVSFADDYNIVNLHNWSMGTFSSISWSEVKSFVPLIAVGAVLAFFLSKGIGAYLYGEEYARSVGVNLKLFRIALVLVSSLLSATVTAFAGPISFVGVAAPHLARRAFKSSDPKRIMIGSFLIGVAFCMLSDWLARRLFAPKELSVSTITAIIGAPIVVSMLLGRKRGADV
ncbi:MAG: FecCD family ABC transporter permease [Thermoguttaceae bacterium]|jgi:iron complex transport system permease protein